MKLSSRRLFMRPSQRAASGFLFVLLMVMGKSAFAKFTYEGYLTDASGHEVVSQTVKVKLEVHTPVGAASDCLFYQEIQNVTTGSDGYFSLVVGAGTRTDSNASLTLDRIFENRGTLSTTSPTCGYTTATGAGRSLKVYFSGDAGASYDVLGVIDLNPSPMATVAEKVAGFAPENLLRAVDASSNPAAVAALTPAQYTEFQALIAGTSTNYMAASAGTAGVKLPSYSTASPPASPVAGSLWYDSTTSSLKFFDGSSSQTLGAGGSGGGITGLSGDVSTTGSSGSVAATVAYVGGSSAGSIHSAELAVNNATSNATPSVLVKRDAAGGFVATNISASALSTLSVAFNDASSNTITMKAPATVLAPYALYLPNAQGNAGTTLVNDGSGNLSWAANGSGSGGSGTVTSIVAGVGLLANGSVGGSVVTSGTLSINTGTAANQIVQLDATAKLPSVNGSALTNLDASSLATGQIPVSRLPSLAGDLNMTAGSNTALVMGIKNTPVAGVPYMPGQILRFDGSSYVPAMLGLQDIRSTVNPTVLMFPLTCSSSETMTWSSVNDTMLCTSITLTVASISGLGTAATKDVGTTANSIVQLDSSGRLPAFDGSLVANLNPSSLGTGSSAITIAAGGSNQSIFILPSGTGRVGIGSTSPAATLDVAGTIVAKENNLGATSSLDFSHGNTVRSSVTSSSGSGITLSLQNMVSGASYRILLTGSNDNVFSIVGCTVHLDDNMQDVMLSHTQFQIDSGSTGLVEFYYSSSHCYFTSLNSYD